MDATQWLLCLLSSVSWTPNAGRKDGRMLACVVIVVLSVLLLSSSLIDSCMFTLVLLTFHPPCESFCCLCESWPHFSLTSCFIWCNSVACYIFYFLLLFFSTLWVSDLFQLFAWTFPSMCVLSLCLCPQLLCLLLLCFLFDFMRPSLCRFLLFLFEIVTWDC